MKAFKNRLEEMAEATVNALDYSDSKVEYPDISIVQKWPKEIILPLYDLYKNTRYSELTSILTYQWAKDNNYIETDYAKYCLPDGTHNTVLSTPELTAEDMITFCNMARKRYYLRIGYILHRLRVGLSNPSDLKRSIKAFGKLKHYLFSSK